MLWVVLTIAVSISLGIVAERRYGDRASTAARRMLKVLLYGFTPPVAFLNIVGLELTADVLEADPRLSRVRGWVEDSGEGRWTVEDAVARAVPLPAITAALFARFRSRRDDPVADRLLAALRHAFGGHDVRR